jgi:O-antigen/teichoic acid export membrane protein
MFQLADNLTTSRRRSALPSEVAKGIGLEETGPRDKINPVPERPDSAKNKPAVLVTMARNAIANLFRTGTSWVILLFLPPLLVRVLDKPTYSVWMLLLQVAAYVTLFDTGMQTAIARFVARAESLQNRLYMARLLSSAGAILLAGSLATIALTAVASWQLNHLFRDIPASIMPNAREALLIIGLSVALTLPFSVIAGLFAGLQKNEINAFAGSLGKFTGALGTAWAAYSHKGLLAMAIWMGLGSLAQCLIYVVWWNKEVKGDLLRPTYVDRSMIREFLFFCSAMFVSHFSAILISGLDMPIVVAFDFRSAAYYAVAATLSNALVVPYGAIVSTLMPVAAAMSCSDKPERMGQLLLRTTRFSTVVLCLITLPLLLGMPLFLRLWVGSDYAIHTLGLAEILIVAQFTRFTMLPYAMVGFAAGQFHRMLASPVSEAIINLLFSLALVRMIGARGVAIGTLIGAFVGVWLHFSISLPRTDCVVLKRRELAWNGILMPIAYTLPVLLVALVLTRRISLPLLQLLSIITAELALISLLWNLSLNGTDREQLKRLFRHTLEASGRLLPVLWPE